MRDMNAKVGVYMPRDGRVVRMRGMGVRNDDGRRFVDCCQRYGLVVGGTIFTHKQVHKGPWRSPDSVTVNQIDHFAIFRRHRCSLLEAGALQGADNGMTNHGLVEAKIIVKLSKESKSQPKRLYDT